LKCLITGANGFVGSRLLGVMSQSEQFDLVAHSRKEPVILISNAEYLPFGIIDGNTNWSPILKNIDVVVHCAARAHIMNERAKDPREEFRKINCNGTLNLAQHCVKSGVKRFIYLSTIGVNGIKTDLGVPFTENDTPHPNNSYALSKLEAEEGLKIIAKNSTLEVVIIRPPLIYGPKAPGNFGSLLKILKRGIPLPLSGIHNKRSLISLDNLIDFILTCISHPRAANEIFVISDGFDISTPELIRGLTFSAKWPNRLFYVPTPVLSLIAKFFGIEEKMQGLCGTLRIDITKAKRLLDWVPPLSVDQSIRAAIVE